MPDILSASFVMRVGKIHSLTNVHPFRFGITRKPPLCGMAFLILFVVNVLLIQQRRLRLSSICPSVLQERRGHPELVFQL